MNEPWRRAPQEVDPLSWFTGPSVPIVLGGVAVVFAVATVAFSRVEAPWAWWEWAAVAALATSAGFLVAFTRNRGRPFAAWRAAIPVVLAWASVVLSGLGHQGGLPRVDLWLAPVSLAILTAAFAPYSSAIRMAVIGGLGCLVALAVMLLILPPPSSVWPPTTQLLLGCATIAVATAAAATFSYQVVRRVLEWGLSEPSAPLTSGVLGEAAKLRILRKELARAGERAVPLLERVSATGVVTADDRAQAARLAEELRAELVERANRSWLDTLARELNITVVDHDHRADRMTPRQRSALMGLLRAGSDDSIRDSQPLVIELRGEADGSTAVAISMDVQLPEGRRVLLLAPHYLSLKTAVDELQWESGEQLRMRFRLPPPAEG